MNKDIENRVVGLLEQNEDLSFLKDNYDINADINSLGINSLIFIKLIVAIENEFDIEFDDDDLEIEKLKNFANLIDYIEMQMNISNE